MRKLNDNYGGRNMEIGFINGEFIDISKPVIPIQERGHQFGDGVYEVVRVYQSTPVLLDEHLERLEKSAQAIQLSLPYSIAEIKKLITEGLNRSGIQEAEVYFQVTRGIADRNHLFPDVKPSFTMTIRPVRTIPDELYSTGIKVMTVEDERWANCYIKSLNLLPNILAKQLANNHGNYEAIFINSGFVKEGSSTNVFVVKNNIIYTAPATKGILNGITRQTIIKLASKLDIEVREEHFSLDFFQDADEAFITSTIIELLPISHVNKVSIQQVNGPITRVLHDAYQELCKKVINQHNLLSSSILQK